MQAHAEYEVGFGYPDDVLRAGAVGVRIGSCAKHAEHFHAVAADDIHPVGYDAGGGYYAQGIRRLGHCHGGRRGRGGAADGRCGGARRCSGGLSGDCGGGGGRHGCGRCGLGGGRSGRRDWGRGGLNGGGLLNGGGDGLLRRCGRGG